ncbi:Caffeic acid 3-O-methyltransferase 2 [Castilleja foliolosa]|uniref:Caffeic acid 3-O-methyltransferase 2 n=1 Tax=Castilleja foliolosa TaxID=1961234 RepID=A0ABD3E7G3_9LAMI
MNYKNSDEEAYLFALELSCGSVLPMVLRAAIELDLPELIKELGGPAGDFVSPADIAARLDPAACTNAAAHLVVDRILRLLASYSILKCTFKDGVGRVYALAPVCKFFTKNEDGVSMAPLFLLQQDKVSIDYWYQLKDVVLEGENPLTKLAGNSAYEVLGRSVRLSNIFNRAMSDHSTIIMNKILDKYDGFDGLKSLVDVGGGTGAALSMITSKYPSIQAINFDLSHVIQNAPSYPGVEHVAGDMFVSVPKGDAIFLKWILHNWTDEHCLKLLENCYESLPEKGKVIVGEEIVPELPDNGRSTKASLLLDLSMMILCSDGKKRTENEFRALAIRAGFKQFNKVCCANNVWILELGK